MMTSTIHWGTISRTKWLLVNKFGAIQIEKRRGKSFTENIQFLCDIVERLVTFFKTTVWSIRPIGEK